jgi:hypothetical protein
VKNFDVSTAVHDDKRAWVAPQLRRLAAGAAESEEGVNPDNSAPQRS